MFSGTGCLLITIQLITQVLFKFMCKTEYSSNVFIKHKVLQFIIKGIVYIPMCLAHHCGLRMQLACMFLSFLASIKFTWITRFL